MNYDITEIDNHRVFATTFTVYDLIDAVTFENGSTQQVTKSQASKAHSNSAKIEARHSTSSTNHWTAPTQRTCCMA